MWTLGGVMLRNTTFNLPDDLVSRAKAYAAQHGTTVTAIIREHLEAVTARSSEPVDDALLAFSRGRLTKEQAVKALRLRDYAELLVALGDADLPLPTLPPHEVENQAATFARIWAKT
jgi:plasmid stability protein